MADIYGSHFEYGGVTSRQYGLIIANVETDRLTQLYGSIEGMTVFNRGTKQRYLIDDDYTDSPISFEVDIVVDEDGVIDRSNRRAIEKWLFNRHDYRKLYIDTFDDKYGETYDFTDGGQKRLYLNCRFVNPEKLEYNGGIVGYRATLEADSGFWWQDTTTQSFTTENESNSDSTIITVSVDTDIDDYTYPKVTITVGESGGDIIISNNSDDTARLTKFEDISANATVVLKGGLNYVSGQYYTKFNKRNFPRLLDGDNRVTIMGNVASIEFEFNNRRAL